MQFFLKIRLKAMPTPKADKSKAARQPASYSKNPKITDEKDLFFIGAVLDEVIAEWSDSEREYDLDDLADFKVQLQNKSNEYKVETNDLGEFFLAKREENEPKTTIEANFIGLSNNPNSKVGVNYKFEGASATASSGQIAEAMETATGEEYHPNKYSIGSLCGNFNFDKNEEEEKLLEALQQNKSKQTATRTKQKSQKNQEDIHIDDPDDMELPEETTTTKAVTNSNRKKLLEEIKESRATQKSTNSEKNVSQPTQPPTVDIKDDDEDKVFNRDNTTPIESEVDELDDLDDDQVYNNLEDTETFQDEAFDDFLNEIASPEENIPSPQKPAPVLETTNSNLEADTNDESEDTEKNRPEKPKRNKAGEVAANRELGTIGQQLTSTGPGLNGFNELGLATQGVQLLAAIADRGTDFINNLLEQAKKKGQADKVDEIIKLAQSTNSRIHEGEERLSVVQNTEAHIEQKGVSELAQSTNSRIDKSEKRLEVIHATSQAAGSQPASSQPTTSQAAGTKTVESEATSPQAPGSQTEAHEKGVPETEVKSENRRERSQATEQPDTPESVSKQPDSNKSQPNQDTSSTVPTADISAKVDRLAKNVGLNEPVGDKLEIDEKASVDEQLKQIKQYLINLNKKLDKVEQRLDAMEEKLGISKAEDNLQEANPMSADPMADYLDEKTKKTVKTTTAADISDSLINYAEAAKEYASSKGQNPGNLVTLPVGNNELVADFRKPQTSIEVTSNSGEQLFAASSPDGKTSKVSVCKLDKEDKDLIADLPQSKEEFGQLISAQSVAKSVLDFSNAAGVDKFKVTVPDTGEQYGFKVEEEKNTGKIVITGTDTQNGSEPAFIATIKGKDSPSIEKNEIPESATSAMSIKLSQRANQKTHQEPEEEPRQSAPVKANKTRETAQAEL